MLPWRIFARRKTLSYGRAHHFGTSFLPFANARSYSQWCYNNQSNDASLSSESNNNDPEAKMFEAEMEGLRMLCRESQLEYLKNFVESQKVEIKALEHSLKKLQGTVELLQNFKNTNKNSQTKKKKNEEKYDVSVVNVKVNVSRELQPVDWLSDLLSQPETKKPKGDTFRF